ncbi:reverse transcriptase domain-containing protein [Tanacetum coccineum]
MMLCLRQRMETITSALLIEKEGIQIPVSYVSRPLQGMKICYTPTEKRVQALIHTTRSLRTIFRKQKVKVEVEGLVMKKFFDQGEQVEGTPDANEEGTFTLSKKLQAKLTPTPKAWRLYVGKETIKEDSGVEIILVSPKEKMHSYAIRLKFHASNHVMDYEALLAGLAAFTNQGMKDLHVFIDSLTLVVEVEGIHTPVTEQERKYKEEILDAIVPFYRFLKDSLKL